MAREAIVGYWAAEPADLTKTPTTPRDFDKLTYLSDHRRFEVLSGELLSAFQAKKEDDGASLFVTPVNLKNLSDGSEATVKPIRICRLFKPSIPDLKAQMIWVRNYADLRGDRISEITDQTTSILQFYGTVGLLNGSRRRATVELLSLVQTLCLMLGMRMKHFCWSPRPVDFATEVQPIIQTPDHSTFPSGHATEAFAIATVLFHLMEGGRIKDIRAGADGTPPPMVLRVAHRIAVNRTVAGVHFPVDSAAGAMLGIAIGEAVIGLAKGEAIAKTEYGGAKNKLGRADFTQKWLMDHHAPADAASAHELDLLAHAYLRAQQEW